MAGRTPALTIVKVVLTLTGFEFFGPIVRDFNVTHALNPSWVGHARLHLVWLLGFMGLSGLANLWLIWLRRPFDVRNLWLSVLWQACNLGGFWVAYALAPSYGGQITVPGIHTHILGYDENVFVFGVLTVVLIAAQLLLRAAAAERDAGAGR